jgi:DNA-binding NtrC family response regulator
MGGEEFFRRLRHIDPTIPVLVSSGYLDGISKDALMKMGVLDVLTKPFRLDQIRMTIQSAVTVRQAEKATGKK